MNNHNQSESEGRPSESTPSQQLEELVKAVMLTPTQMLNLTSDDQKFTEKIIEYNEIGILHINNEDYTDGLVYLQEAEKLLEYAASCGKTIDRILIISTLQNQACAYQRLWELEKSSNYMEAIIFNMNSYLDNGPQFDIGDSTPYSDPEFSAMASLFVNKRLSIALYYLQFSAVSSQTKKHETALKSAFKALETLKLVCSHCYNFQQYLRKGSSSDENAPTNTILKTLSAFSEDVDLEKYPKYLKQTKRAIAKLRHRINLRSSTTDPTIKILREFTIGEVMQISPITVSQMSKRTSIKEQINFLNKIYKSIYISICLFAIATELRLISSEKYVDDAQKKRSVQYKQSQIYHLNSIYLASLFSPSETLYLEHILKSFKNHYDLDLSQASSLLEVSSIEVESQNLLDLDRGKIFHKQQQMDLENTHLKGHLKSSTKQNATKTKISTLATEPYSDNNLKVTHRNHKKKKKNIIHHHSKPQLLRHFPQKPKSTLKLDKPSAGHTMLKSIDYTPKIQRHRKNSSNPKKDAIGLRDVKMVLNYGSSPTKNKQKSKKKSKSSDKHHSKGSHRSKSGKKLSFKQKSLDHNETKQRVKRKTAKLHEEYFQKNEKKRSGKRESIVASIKNPKVNEYGTEMIRKSLYSYSSTSRLSHNKSNSKVKKVKH